MADSDLDPQAFLKTVRDLSDKRQREDNERYERLEAQILQDRTARLERKAERERSLSPEKTPTSIRSYGARTPINASSPIGSRHASPTRELTSPIRELIPEESSRSSRFERMSPGPIDRPSSPTKPESPSAAMPSRANTMSWQRRPQSGARNRPLSHLAAENNASRASPEPGSEVRPSSRDEPSQQDIARSLSTKDPSWFRQTPDRGVGSAAYRRSVQEEEDTTSAFDKRHLPGLARPASGITSPPVTSPERDSSSTPNRESTPEVEKAAFGRNVPSLQSRASLNRPISPTRGMGGFVESAMMKRTDSVSKRWSNQNSGLMRADSSASLRSGYGSTRSSFAGPSGSQRQGLQEELGENVSSLGSSHDTLGALRSLNLQDTSSGSTSPTRQHGSFHSRSKSHASLREPSTAAANLPPTFSPPLSPSKRFSPTKSSWLESALARPESPTKQMSPTQSQQPSWMVELNKSKQQRNSTATFSSQDDVVLETASVKAFQPLKASTTQVTSSGPFGSTANKPTEQAKRNFTPPTKAKPAGLVAKLSRERLASPTSSSSPSIDNASKPLGDSLGITIPEESPTLSATKTPEKSHTPTKGFGSSPKASYVASPPRDAASPSRTRPADKEGASTPEFLNAFGKLKRTTTQNYVAPDVLKDNILRGKAGLAITGGPKKTERVDEFKDSILKKKAEMKAKAPEPGTKSARNSPQAVPTPEALLVKKGLQRSTSNSLTSSSPTPKRDITPEALARHKTLRGKPIPPGAEAKSKLAQSSVIESPVATSAIKSQPNPDMSTSTPITSEKKTPANQSVSSKPIVETVQPQVVAKSPSPVKSSAIADKFNPALAGLLARGPPPASSSTKSNETKTNGSDFVAVAQPRTMKNEPEESKGQELTHMTKDRARGPKRRKPKSSAQAESKASTASQTANIKTVELKGKPVTVSTPAQPRPKSAAVRTLSLNLSDQLNQKDSQTTPTKSATFPIGISNDKPSPKPKAQTPTSVEAKLMSGSDDFKENANTLPSVKNAAAMWGRADQASSSPSRGMPIKLPSKEDEEAAMRSAGLLASSKVRSQPSKPQKLGTMGAGDEAAESTLSPPSSAGGPPKPGKSSRAVSQTLADAPTMQDDSALTTPTANKPPQSRAEKLLQSYFGQVPEFRNRLQLDPQTVLADTDAASSVRTLRKTIQLISENGKLTPLPAEKEYILYSGSMYIVSHVYGSSSGQRQTDVFLWAGSDIGNPAIEDAQIFAKRVAKEAAQGSRTIPSVEVVRETGETHEFFQALGGIVVIRRGLHTDSATKPYMLCGRPHIHHVAFDEMDLALGSLQPMFPCIVVNPRTNQDTQVFLWKGKSCGAEIVGSARLISMDLAAADVIEVVAGDEPAEFLSLLRSSSSVKQETITEVSQIRLSDKLAPRLFRFDALMPRRSSSSFFGFFGKRPTNEGSRPSSAHRPASAASNRSITTPPAEDTTKVAVHEISPFTQADLEPEQVYLLDCITSVFILPGPTLVSQPATLFAPRSPDPAFATADSRWEARLAQACLFAQDYALLAAGLQDRPCLPSVQLVFGDLPPLAKVLFRRWDEQRGLWGAAGRSAGAGEGAVTLAVQDVLDVCCVR